MTHKTERYKKCRCYTLHTWHTVDWLLHLRGGAPAAAKQRHDGVLGRLLLLAAGRGGGGGTGAAWLLGKQVRLCSVLGGGGRLRGPYM